MAAAEDRILDAAETVFSSKGYLGGALNDVAVAAGYTRAGLLHYFPNKEALLLALLERRDVRLHIWELVVPGMSLADLCDVIENRMAELKSIRMLIQLGHIVTAEATSPDHPAYEWVHQRERELRTRITDAVRLSQERGEVDRDWDPEVAAAVVLGSFEGLETQWLLDDGVDLDAGVAFIRALLLPARR
ncbi:TetR/AcrR family transcriptional regulator [Agromyces albus]|uniref:TetR/AcrR family transcriptional regulator n=1 Tax=Agromyces albus TaxID=205332 RepID=A0A4Q2KZ05_9MICO|nr:TetR family transcriptional regulator [Agromyces albus]RXZ70257.1 TetR/AcrR family transcriptional regulator [Agromyces albus]